MRGGGGGGSEGAWGLVVTVLAEHTTFKVTAEWKIRYVLI